MENLNLDRPKLFQQQREDDSTREKPTRLPVCQSPLTVAQSKGGFHELLQKKGAKLYRLSLAGLEISLWRLSETLGSCVCLLSSCLNPQPLLGCSQCMIVYVTLT